MEMFGGKGRKERKRLMALLLAGAMVLSGTGISPLSVQAEEVTVEQVQEAESVEEVVEETVSGGDIEVPKAGETENAETGEMSEVAVQAAEVAVPVVQSADGTYVFESSALSAVAAGAKADGDTEAAGTEDYFTLIYSAKTKVDGSSKSFDDGYSSSQRVNFGDVVSVDKNAIKFKTSNAATVKIWWAEGGDNNRQMAILNGSGTVVAQTNETLAKNAACYSELKVKQGGTYYLGSIIGNNYIFKVLVEEEQAAKPIISTLETSSLTSFTAGAKADGDTETAGTKDYFTLIYSAKTKVDSSSKSFDDGYSSSQRLNFGDVVSVDKNAIKFKTSNAATVKIWWAEGGDNNRQMAILNGSGTVVAQTNETLAKNAACCSELKVKEAGTYYLGSSIGNNYIFKVVVTEEAGGSVKPERKNWSEVANPVITAAEVNAEKAGQIDVTVTAEIGYDGADKIAVTMSDAQGKEIETKNSSKEGSEATVSFTPAASGTYTFAVKAIRADEEDKQGAETKSCEFVLPLTQPVIKGVTCLGGGKAKVAWNAVKEAEKYLVTVDGTYTTDGKSIEKEVTAPVTEVVIEGLKVDQEATIYVTAVRGADQKKSDGFKKKIVDELQYEWAFTYYGPSTSSSKNKYQGDASTGTARVIADGGAGKLQPTATDGLGFYYTAVPTDKNFTFSATLKVNSWVPNNGQEGFGIMAADRVGTPGEGSNAYWNNSYMAVVGKVEYNWDAANGKVSDAGDKISMKLGIGAQEKIGVTNENLGALNANDSATLKNDYKTSMWPLDTSCAQRGTGTYNMIGNNTAVAAGPTVDNPVTELKLKIQKNNTGYFISYTDAAGNTETKKYYGTDNLNVLDNEYVYVGMFAARGTDVTYSDIKLTLIDPADDAPAEEREVTLVTPAYNIISASVSNSAAYDLVYSGNADGKLSVTAPNGSAVVSNKAVAAGEKVTMPVSLTEGSNKFRISFTPNSDYRPDEYSKLSSYETVTYEYTVTYKNIRGDQKTIYVAPEGSAGATGSKENPVDIYTAVKYARPGQMIILKGGVYSLTSTVKVERGIDGTKNQMIYLIADPTDSQRPVFDFNKACAGMVFAGDYWYCQGFDVTNSQNTQKGLQISGSNCVFDNIQAYHNGNTGIQVARYLTTDEREDWPSNDLILNCTSYGNADIGYEDADGFAAKLTVGEGIVFDGCIAYNNADDGWDLFAKVETGSIGSVTIKNCVAYGNGYLEDGTNAGNGNGFKMGGSSITGYHTLINSVAFGNKAKGIDSNSCPDIQVKQSTTFNNESYNVAFYTNAGSKTDFGANGILSYRTSKLEQQEQLKLLQDEATIRTATNYFWNETQKESVNSEGMAAKASWFVSTENPKITRNANGTINMNGFLELTAEAPEGVGARMTGTPSAVFTVTADVVREDDHNNDNNTPSAPSTVDWNSVSSSVQEKVAEIANNPAIATVNMNMVCTGEVKVPQNVLNTIKGTSVTVAFHSGNGVAMSISGQDLKNKDLSKLQNIDLTVDQNSNNIPANMVTTKSGSVNRQLALRDTGNFGVNVNIHVNVGRDNAGKSANLYRYNAEKGRLEYCGSFTVTSNGQSMFAMKRGGNYLVTVTERRPSESIWYVEGDYTVKSGDTLSAIAKRNHMSLAELLRRNSQIANQNVIRVGQKLILN